MAQLFFRYGAMNSGKSIDILKVKHNYEENGRNVILMTSVIDDRDGVGYVSSRIGLKQKAVLISGDSDIEEIIHVEMGKSPQSINCVLVDEAQFLMKEQVEQLSNIADYNGIPVICYGLKNDFQNNLFEGSKALMEYADKIEEIKTLCKYCDSKATMNLRIHDEMPVYHGEQIKIGGNESYVPVCRKHYKKPPMDIL